MVKENTFTVMDQHLKEIGDMTCLMVKEQNIGVMAPDTKDNMKKGKNTE